ncbi:MAG TPA: sigma-70 family RNA polymerase sigma factor [Acidobacteriaceae bacterium]|nr:sigma-70 family RNA polymerase sigma factor [Acidobacteriaceae bacterium]
MLEATFTNHGHTQINSLAVVSDVHLVAAAKNGETAAYVELCRRHRDRLRCVAQRITKNKEDAEDILQDTFMRAFVHLDKFDGRSAFSTWITRIAINNALMLLRKKRGYTVASLEDLSSISGKSMEIVEHSPGPEDHVIRKEMRSLARKAVQGLPPKLRSVMEIHLSLDSSILDTAAAAGISVAATKTRLLRARRLVETRTRSFSKAARSRSAALLAIAPAEMEQLRT